MDGDLLDWVGCTGRSTRVGTYHAGDLRDMSPPRNALPFLFSLSLFLMSYLSPGIGVAEEKQPLFVDAVRLKGVPASMNDTVSLWGEALAAEISGVLREAQSHSPMTLQNLEAQLGMERQKAALACADSSCLNRIVENFGISESLFGTVMWLGKDRVQLTLVYTAGFEKVGEAVPRYAGPNYEEMAKAYRAMVREIFGLPVPHKEGTAATPSPNTAVPETVTALPLETPTSVRPSPPGRGTVHPRQPASREKSLGIEWVISQYARVEFSRGEVTVAQFRACVDAGACAKRHFKAKSDYDSCNWGNNARGDHPMNCVTWDGAKQFCEWAGGRLPEEREWKQEAFASGTRQYPWGSGEPSCSRLIMNEGGNGCGEERTWRICAKPLGNSISGICDFAGNVYEWTASRPAPDDNGSYVLLGGSWDYSDPSTFNGDHRTWDSPTLWDSNVGFRCVRSAP